MSELCYLEAKIVNHCNFQCRACVACANIAHKSEYGLLDYERDIRRIAELFDRVTTFRLIGGEPLLCKNINQYLAITRKYLPDSDVRLVTNGSLIKNMDQPFFNHLLINSIKLDISIYINKTSNNKKVEEGIEILNKKGIEYQVKNRKFFYLTFDNQKEKNIDDVFKSCRQRSICNNLYRGKIYPCVQSYSYQIIDEKFGTSYYNPKDGIDIHEGYLTGDKLLNELEKPLDSCKYCSVFPSFMLWEEGKAKLQDWSVHSDNYLLHNQVKLYDYLTYMERIEINITHIDINKKIEFERIDFKELSLDMSFDIYIWLTSSNCYNYYEHFLKQALCEHHIDNYKLIKNNIVTGAFGNIEAIDKKDIAFPCYIIFFSSPFSTNKLSFYNAVRNINKQLINTII